MCHTLVMQTQLPCDMEFDWITLETYICKLLLMRVNLLLNEIQKIPCYQNSSNQNSID